MENLQTKSAEKESFYQNCINEFGNVEEAMKDVAQHAAGNNLICSEMLCGSTILVCTNLY